MIYNLNTYRRVIKPVVASWLEAKCDHQGNPILDQASPLALSTSCPILVVCYFMGELRGFTPELNKLIDTLKDFYHIEKIEGQLDELHK